LPTSTVILGGLLYLGSRQCGFPRHLLKPKQASGVTKAREIAREALEGSSNAFQIGLVVKASVFPFWSPQDGPPPFTTTVHRNGLLSIVIVGGATLMTKLKSTRAIRCTNQEAPYAKHGDGGDGEYCGDGHGDCKGDDDVAREHGEVAYDDYGYADVIGDGAFYVYVGNVVVDGGDGEVVRDCLYWRLRPMLMHTMACVFSDFLRFSYW
jgi:hypothetical protein